MKLHSVTICALWFDEDEVHANVMITTSEPGGERVSKERRIDLGRVVAEDNPMDTAHAVLLSLLDKL